MKFQNLNLFFFLERLDARTHGQVQSNFFVIVGIKNAQKALVSQKLIV